MGFIEPEPVVALHHDQPRRPAPSRVLWSGPLEMSGGSDPRGEVTGTVVSVDHGCLVLREEFREGR